MVAPRSKYHGPSPVGWEPCKECLRYAGEWSDPDKDGVRHPITAPRHADVAKGEPWVCVRCQNEST